MTTIASHALVSLAVLVLVLVFIYGPWQWICTDYARQVLFEKRDEIFDMAADGEIGFKSREYIVIRSSLEACIRFAHDLTLPIFLFLALSRKGSDHVRTSGLHAAVDALPEHIRERVRHKVTEAMAALTLMMLLKSPIGTVVCVPLTLMILLAESCKARAYKLAEACGEIIQVEAELSPSAIKVLRQPQTAF